MVDSDYSPFLKRFILLPVNPNFSEKLISEVPPILCKEHIVCCDGGEGALGHPKVYINLVTAKSLRMVTFPLHLAKYSHTTKRFE
ncbi:unnamed protein product [Echinostoma caproni]|uniref:Zf-CHCC domain-containing protein n=1 Tax=Echinostoma caproni TaxID=27848 RepID=A0A183ADR3_9TREM|nr:unnamed protein product [Echinostoma caproni]